MRHRFSNNVSCHSLRLIALPIVQPAVEIDMFPCAYTLRFSKAVPASLSTPNNESFRDSECVAERTNEGIKPRNRHIPNPLIVKFWQRHWSFDERSERQNKLKSMAATTYFNLRTASVNRSILTNLINLRHASRPMGFVRWDCNIVVVFRSATVWRWGRRYFTKSKECIIEPSYCETLAWIGCVSRNPERCKLTTDGVDPYRLKHPRGYSRDWWFMNLRIETLGCWEAQWIKSTKRWQSSIGNEKEEKVVIIGEVEGPR